MLRRLIETVVGEQQLQKQDEQQQEQPANPEAGAVSPENSPRGGLTRAFTLGRKSNGSAKAKAAVGSSGAVDVDSLAAAGPTAPSREASKASPRDSSGDRDAGSKKGKAAPASKASSSSCVSGKRGSALTSGSSELVKRGSTLDQRGSTVSAASKRGSTLDQRGSTLDQRGSTASAAGGQRRQGGPNAVRRGSMRQAEEMAAMMDALVEQQQREADEHGQSGRLGEAIAGHHGLRSFYLKAGGRPPHS